MSIRWRVVLSMRAGGSAARERPRVPLHLVEMTTCDLFIHKRKTSLGTRCSTLPGSLRCWCYERIMWRAAAPDGKIGVQGFVAQRAASTTPTDSESGDAESIGSAGHAQARRGGLATRCSSPVLVLEPGDVGLGHRKPTAMGRRRAAAPPPGDRALRIARSAQARGRCASIAGVSAVITGADVAIFVPWRRGRKQAIREADDR